MAQSMTGFGRYEAEQDGRLITVELKSVNHRFLDLSLRYSRSLGFLEETVRSALSQKLARGHVDVFITYENHSKDARQVELDVDLLNAYMQKAMSVQAIAKMDIGIRDFLRMPDVFTVVEQKDDQTLLEALCKEATQGACAELIAMRQKEGQRLCADMAQRAQMVLERLKQIQARAPLVVEEYKARLQSRIAELLSGNVPTDHARLANEVAIFADRASIEEEIVRLESHLRSFLQLLQSHEAVGRKLDFLVQEMNREMNTIGSKASDLTITKLVIEEKSELEKIREQVQNMQ